MSASLQLRVGPASRRTAVIAIAANTQNYLLNTAKVAGYIPGKTDVTLTINGGIVVGSSSTANPAFDVDTSWAAGDRLTVVVSSGAYIVGRGGNGARTAGAGSNIGSYPAIAGDAGGPALRVQRAVTINNAGTIGGGGGGGGDGGPNNPAVSDGIAGGGGGGAGNDAGYRNAGGPYGGGGPGNNVGTLTTGGTGQTAVDGGKGGDGGGLGATGSTGAAGGAGGGAAGGSGGNCTTSGSNANITWTATGTRLGTIA